MTDNQRYIIDVLDITLDVIDKMASGDQESYSAADLAREFNINRSRTFRILKTLELHNYVDFNPETETYKLGLKFLVHSENIRGRLNLRRLAAEVLKTMATETGDAAYLVVLNGKSAVIVDFYIGNNNLQVAAPIGQVMPLHIGASPKLLLAFLPPSEIEHILDQIELKQFTPHTITNLSTFRKNLDDIRRAGYSIDDQEYEIGVYAFAAPVRDYFGNVVAGITISTPTARYSPERRIELIQTVVAAAKKLSMRLGYQPEPELRT
jgi:IclR family KDG regulon transcriptional repressor